MSRAQTEAGPGRSTNPSPAPVRLLIAQPRGFCAGVRRAIEAVETALERFGPPVYVRRAIVHNLAVVRSLEAKGAIFVPELEDAPVGAVVILSAHGVGRHVHRRGESRDQRLFDAICPLVAKVHREVERHHRSGRHVVLIGHAGHPEVEGTLGQLPRDAASLVASPAEVEQLPIPAHVPVAYAVQTTFSLDEAEPIVAALKAKFRDLLEPPTSDICYATTNRQRAAKRIAAVAEAMIVVGESFSSNARRLVEVSRLVGCTRVQLVGEPANIDWNLIEGCSIVGLTAAASTPESSVQEVIAALASRIRLVVDEVEETQERTVFRPVDFGRC